MNEKCTWTPTWQPMNNVSWSAETCIMHASWRWVWRKLWQIMSELRALDSWYNLWMRAKRAHKHMIIALGSCVKWPSVRVIVSLPSVEAYPWLYWSSTTSPVLSPHDTNTNFPLHTKTQNYHLNYPNMLPYMSYYICSFISKSYLFWWIILCCQLMDVKLLRPLGM